MFKINGLSGASYLYFIAQHFKGGLVIVPSSLDTARAAQTLEFFSGIPSRPLPAFERLFEPLRQEPEILYERLTCLSFLMEHNTPQYFIVTNLEALSQATLSQKEFKNAILSIKKGDWLEREAFILKLLSMGFKRDELAEDQGFFSVRGHLIDVFSPFDNQPYRIEFFGDEVVSIRKFDVISQRSLEELTTLKLFPCRELIIDPQTFQKAREKIKNLADERGFDPMERERVIGDLQEQRDVIESRWLLPAFAQNLVSPLDYLPQKLDVVWVDRSDAIQLYQASLEADQQAYEDLQKIAFPPPSLRSDLHSLLEKPDVHELSRLISGQGQTYNVMGLEELRDRLTKSKSFGPLESLVLDLKEKNITTSLVIQSPKRRAAMAEAMSKATGAFEWSDGPLFDGFWSETFRRAFITERDIFGIKKKSASYTSRTKEDFLRQFSDLKDGDFVIHEDHGIARYHGLQAIKIQSATTEFLVLEYADNDKLYLPVYRLDKLSRYVSEGYASPRLDKLGSQVFLKRKAKIREDILKIAHELLEIAAKRRLSKVNRDPIMDKVLYHNFCQSFPYELTPDQESAIAEIEKDLSQDFPMDRLVCGDVGFGKTEVAMRAAMLALLRGKQVAILAPTTILVEQHYRNFLKRFSKTPFKVDHVSRFLTNSQQREILDRVEKGTVNLIIGTHRLLSSEVKFENLGLLIIDEEQRFGVKHKERIKRLRGDLDILTLSATPIPRTLQMSVTGLRELSLITTPPENREAVKTYVATFDEALIKKAIEKELSRGGQVLFVHNRVQSIDALAQRLQSWLPKIRIVVAHGQMDEKDLEERMMTFIEGKADILLATSIIENGLDIANANTILVDHAEIFGLSNLYQLRGRVGRSNVTAVAYYLIHETTTLTPEASKRLQVIQSCTELGSGFNVATHDLEIRGSGNILGEEQSGVIAEVGLELYTQMLQETLNEIRNHKPQEPLPELNMGYNAYIPETYIPDPAIRILTYKQLNRVRTPGELLLVEEELLDRFGLYPKEVENFCEILRLRTIAQALKARTLDLFPTRLTMTLSPQTSLEPNKVIPLLKDKKISLDPKGRLSFQFDSDAEAPEKDFQKCREFLRKLCELAQISIDDLG